MDLHNKKVLVTGATAGLGLALTELLLEQGAYVIATSRPSEKLEELKQKIKGDNCEVIACDVSDIENVKAVAEQVGAIDILINNAGLWIDGPLQDYDYEYISKVVDVNLKGVIYMTRAFIGNMLKQRHGAIVNVSSTSGTKAREKQSVYAATKWALKGFSDSLKLDTKGTGVDVIGFYPGGMDTGLFKKGGSDVDTTGWMRTEDVADVLVYLLTRPENMLIDDIVINKKVS